MNWHMRILSDAEKANRCRRCIKKFSSHQNVSEIGDQLCVAIAARWGA